MLSNKFLEEIEEILNNSNLLERIKEKGLDVKEVGHSFSSFVEKEVYDILGDRGYNVFSQDKKVRSIEDGWIENNYSNVKFGVKFGQPNICSLRKILDKINDGKLDCYIIIWTKILGNELKVKVFDLLSNLDYVVYNAGPGQLMFKESKFYQDIDNITRINSRSLEKKKNTLAYLQKKETIKNIDNRIKNVLSRCDTEKEKEDFINEISSLIEGYNNDD